MLDTTYLYDPIRNRYKGVYLSKVGNWEAIITTPDGKYTYIGKAPSQEECAQVVAKYYSRVYGPDWPELLEDRKRRYWRVRKIPRTAQLTVYIAEVREPGQKLWRRVEDADISAMPLCVPPHADTSVPGWNWSGKGWVSAGAALVAIRTFRFIHQCA